MSKAHDVWFFNPEGLEYKEWLEKKYNELMKANSYIEELEDLLYFGEIIDKGNYDTDNLEEVFESDYYDGISRMETERLTDLRSKAILNSKERNKA